MPADILRRASHRDSWNIAGGRCLFSITEDPVSCRPAGALVVLLSAVAVSLADAQPWPEPEPIERPATADDLPPPLTIAYVDGRADVVRAGGIEPAIPPDILEEDDRLVTADGRAELVFADGALAHVDRDTDIRIDLGVRLRLVSGRLAIHTPSGADPLVVAVPSGLVRLDADGEYVLTADDLRGDTEIAVVDGRAVFTLGEVESALSPDDVLIVHPRDPRPRWSRGIPRDAFLEWSRARTATNTSSTSPAPLPASLRPWGSNLAAYGSWSTMAPYGPVWFPAAGPSWRPFANGSWRYTRYGWTWIDVDPWAWPLHHYGRWGHHDVRGWYWMPHRAWAPAWVGWAVAADHIAWAPLGWNARPLVDFSIGLRVGPVGLWASSWSIVPRSAFGYRGSIIRHVQDPRRLPGPVLGGFVSQMIGPRGPAGSDDRFARRPSRQPAPSTGPGWAVPRSGSPTPRPGDARVVDEPRGDRRDGWRRPGDAPADGRERTPSPGVVERPGYREWSTAPAPDAGDAPRDGRRRDPIGPPVRPSVPPPGDTGAAGGERPRGGVVAPRRGDDSSGRRPGSGPSPSPAGTDSGGRGAVRRAPDASGDGGRGAVGGSARPRGGPRGDGDAAGRPDSARGAGGRRRPG
jgi:hypothetical protein